VEIDFDSGFDGWFGSQTKNVRQKNGGLHFPVIHFCLALLVIELQRLARAAARLTDQSTARPLA